MTFRRLVLAIVMLKNWQSRAYCSTKDELFAGGHTELIIDVRGNPSRQITGLH